jgi:hypothetical protein
MILVRRKVMSTIFARAAIIAASVMFVAVSGPALAQNAHFLRAVNQGISDSTDTITFKIAGLGSAVTTTVTAEAEAAALYACQNNGGNFPSDPKKQEETGTVSASGEFTSGKNGSITGGLTLSAPASTLNCPGGQTEVLVCVEFENKRVSEPAAGTQEATPSSASTILLSQFQAECEELFANNPAP